MLSCETSRPSPAPAISERHAIAQPESARGTIGISDGDADGEQHEPGEDDPARAAVARPLARRAARRRTCQRERREREAGLHRVVLEHHLQVDRQRDHQPAERDLLQRLRRDPEPEVLRREQADVEQRRLALALAPAQPPDERPERDRADGDERADRLAALLPDEDPEHDAAHAERGEDRADDVDALGARVRDVVDEPAAGEHDRDDHDLAEERDAPGEVRRDEAAEQRPDGGGDRGRGADERVGPPLHRALEVPVDQRLHRREQERRAEPADDRPEDDDREQALRQRHRQRARRVAEQAEDVGALAADQVADLAADQDERRRDERLERDRRLHAAGGRVEVVHDRGDRHVHQRRVDDEDEHRHREQDRQPRRRPSTRGGGRVDAHRLSAASRRRIIPSHGGDSLPAATRTRAPSDHRKYVSLSQSQLSTRSPVPDGRLAALRACDVRLEQPLLEQRRGVGAPRDHRDLRVPVERPRVEVDRAEADDVVGDDDLGVDDRAGELPDLDARSDQVGVAVPERGASPGCCSTSRRRRAARPRRVGPRRGSARSCRGR